MLQSCGALGQQRAVCMCLCVIGHGSKLVPLWSVSRNLILAAKTTFNDLMNIWQFSSSLLPPPPVDDEWYLVVRLLVGSKRRILVKSVENGHMLMSRTVACRCHVRMWCVLSNSIQMSLLRMSVNVWNLPAAVCLLQADVSRWMDSVNQMLLFNRFAFILSNSWRGAKTHPQHTWWAAFQWRDCDCQSRCSLLVIQS